jgi:hypothetical protein
VIVRPAEGAPALVCLPVQEVLALLPPRLQLLVDLLVAGNTVVPPPEHQDRPRGGVVGKPLRRFSGGEPVVEPRPSHLEQVVADGAQLVDLPPPGHLVGGNPAFVRRPVVVQR